MLDNLNTSHKVEIDSNNLKLLFLSEMEKNYNVYRACNKLKISRTLVYSEWMKDKEFCRRLDTIKENHIDDIEGNIFNQAKDPKMFTPAMFVLKSHRANVYGDRTEINVNHQLASDINSKALETLNRMKEIKEAEFTVIQPEQIPSNSNTADSDTQDG